MILIVLSLLFLLCLWGFRFTKKNPNYISLEGTNAIKGLFAIIILCSHMGSYLAFSDSLADKAHLWFMGYLGQTMVAPYLFYSGYGIYYSFQHKPNYVSGFFRRRFLKTQIHFDLAILLFVIVQAFFPFHYPGRNYLLCWIGWESVGNSNWFIFVILALYLITLCGLLVETRKRHTLLPFVIILSGTLWVLLHCVAHKDNWWVDTIAAFPLGMAFSAIQERMEARFQFDKFFPWAFSFILMFALYIGWHHIKGVDVYGICGCLFCVVITIVTMKIRIGNPILTWLGKHAFAIYILQRLPMIILSYYGINQTPALFITIAIFTTLLLAEGFTRFTNRLDLLLFHA